MELTEMIKQAANSLFDEIVSIRRALHRRPELSFQEYETAAYICRYLKKLGIPYHSGVAGTGVVGLIAPDTACRKTLLLRADMDALPVTEVGNLPYASETSGVMHACGHDGHIAVLLGTAAILMQFREHLSCNVKLVFQPGEEAEGGAQPMIEAGVLENPTVDAAVGLHIMNDVPCGKIRVKTGPMMAAPDDFDLIIKGRGGHGAHPDECVDPISVACQIVSAFDTLSARFASPFEPKVISVCAINGGSFFNIIPDSVHLKGTVRAYDKTLREKLPQIMENLAKHFTLAYGADYDFSYRFRFPPLINDKAVTNALASSAAEILGAENILSGGIPSMAGDDFSYFSETVPATYFNLGSRNEEKHITAPLHNADFDIDENCLRCGMMVMSKFALDFGKF